MQGLYRSAGQRKQADFLGRDFSQPAARAAACKNAYVLLAQHRAELAASFFILGEAPAGSCPTTLPGGQAQAADSA